MVVLSVAILSKSTPLLARQFVEMTKIRIQGLLSAFPKLLDKRATDHTFIDTENARYIYQPIESLFIILITNKHSNILEDLETLRLLAQIVQDICQETISEDLILKNAFDIIFAFDEVITFGYKEMVTTNQIQVYTQMESNAENFHKIVQKNKEKEEIERRVEFTKKIEKDKRKKSKEEKLKGHGHRPRTISPLFPAESIETPIIDPLTTYKTETSIPVRGKGMNLEVSKNKGKFFEIETTPPASKSSHMPPAAPAPSPLNPLVINIIERISGRIHFEGNLETMSAEGSFEASFNKTSEVGFAAFKITEKDKRFKFSIHPSLDKSAFNQNILKLRDENKPHIQHVTLVKWRLPSPYEELVPFYISCWPSEIAGGTSVSIEIELSDPQFPLEDIHVQLMCPEGSGLEVSKLTEGYLEEDGITLHWRIPTLTQELGAALFEFTYNLVLSSEFEFTIEATGKNPPSQLKVSECFDMKSNAPIDAEINQKIHYSFLLIQ